MDSDGVSILPEFCRKRTLILGCGNTLFGDDGFGPAVIEYLTGHHAVPEDVCIMDAGTGARKILFTLALSPERTREVVIVDAVDKGKRPGEIFEVELEGLPFEKTDNFSLHQVPSSNLARDLRSAGVDVRVLVCQTSPIPDIVKPGLSDAVHDAVAKMGDLIVKEFF